MFSIDGTQTAAVSTGVLDPTAGARADAWLSWKSQDDGVCLLEDATEDFARRLAAGIQERATPR